MPDPMPDARLAEIESTLDTITNYQMSSCPVKIANQLLAEVCRLRAENEHLRPVVVQAAKGILNVLAARTAIAFTRRTAKGTDHAEAAE